MIIIRQKSFANIDHGGNEGGLKGKVTVLARNWKAGRLRKMRKNEQAGAEKRLAGMGIETKRVALTDAKGNPVLSSTGKQLVGTQYVNTGTKLNNANAEVVKENILGRYNRRTSEAAQRISGSAGNSLTTTKNNLTETYKKNAAAKAAKAAASKPAAGKKLGVGGKIGIAAAALGTTALAATAIKKGMNRRKEKQQQEAQAQYQQPQQ